MPLNTKSLALLQLVNPELSDKIKQLAEMMDLAGEPIQVVQGLRSYAQQAALYAQGRTQPGNIVTDSPPGHSWHEFGLAADVCPESLLATPNWSPSSPIWKDLGNKGKSLGLFWGGDFTHIHDQPHFQLNGTFPLSPNDEARQTFMQAGMTSVWKEAGLSTGEETA
jgi:peptidoglycan L-alanyl-D-glutamate endopeptidase CwlK